MFKKVSDKYSRCETECESSKERKRKRGKKGTRKKDFMWYTQCRLKKKKGQRGVTRQFVTPVSKKPKWILAIVGASGGLSWRKILIRWQIFLTMWFLTGPAEMISGISDVARIRLLADSVMDRGDSLEQRPAKNESTRCKREWWIKLKKNATLCFTSPHHRWSLTFSWQESQNSATECDSVHKCKPVIRVSRGFYTVNRVLKGKPGGGRFFYAKILEKKQFQITLTCPQSLTVIIKRQYCRTQPSMVVGMGEQRSHECLNLTNDFTKHGCWQVVKTTQESSLFIKVDTFLMGRKVKHGWTVLQSMASSGMRTHVS